MKRGEAGQLRPAGAMLVDWEWGAFDLGADPVGSNAGKVAITTEEGALGWPNSLALSAR